MSETQLSNAIQRALSAAGFYPIRIQAGRAKSGRMKLAPEGTPDLYVLGCGWLEVKVPGEKPRAEQVRWHERARRHGDLVATVRSPREAIEACIMFRDARAPGKLTDEHRAAVIHELWEHQGNKPTFVPLYSVVSEYHRKLMDRMNVAD